MHRDTLVPLVRAFALSALCAAVFLIIYGALLVPPVLELLFHTDILHPHALLDDVFLQGGSVFDWTLPPNPSLFPDGALYLISWAAGTNFRWALVWYAWLSLSITIVSVHWLLRELNVKYPFAQSLFLVSVFCLPLLWEISPFHPHRAHFASVALLPISHGSIIALALIVWCLALRAWRSAENSWRVTYVAALTLAASSDRLVHTAIGAPLLILFFIEWRKNSNGAFTLGILTLLGLALGELLLQIIGRTIPLGVVPQPLGDSWLTTVVVGIDALAKDLSGNPHWAVIAAMLVGWSFFALTTKTDTHDPAYQRTRWFFALGILFTLVAPVASGVYREGAMRYVVPGLMLGLVGAAISLQAIPRLYRFMLSSVLIMLLVAASFEEGKGAYFWYRPRVVRCLDSISTSLPTRVGVADYWNSKKFTYLNESGLFLVPLEKTGELAIFAANKKWDEKYKDKVSFALMDRLSLRALRARFGRSEEVSKCGGQVVRVFKP